MSQGDSNPNRASNPRGYFSCVRRHQANTKCPLKRFFVHECVRQICSLKGIMSFQDVCHHHDQRRKILDILIRPPTLTSYEASLVRVKRQLFREPKQKQRKQPNHQIRRNVKSETECWYYKLQRRELGTKQIPRKYLDEAMIVLCEDVRGKLTPKYKRVTELYEHINSNEAVRHNLKRKWSELQELTHHLNIEANVIVESDEIVRKARRYRLDDEIKQKANHKMIQATERSLCYIDKIMGLILDDGQSDEDFLAM